MTFKIRTVSVVLGGLTGVLSGAVACVLYSCLYLGISGDLALLRYELYALPTLAFIGSSLGLFVGSVVAWVYSAPALAAKARLSLGVIASWAVGGSVYGALLVMLIAVTLWRFFDGRGEAGYLVKVSFAGAIVGAAVAVCVGFSLALIKRTTSILCNDRGNR
jgi:hypothetical protein